ncbi:MAG TPA: ribosomal protein S18-alanine N-acetyltransferase [Pyrinomonadaceae bacterium]|jgi:ribosomal-protein-alanine N-acetyltransferase|nr:ribosomal protein S18-alanine N-acetyltransferase [Pyrinomonadaceae bacterium]
MTAALEISRMTVADIPVVLQIQEACQLSPWDNNSYRKALKDPDFILYIAKFEEIPIGFSASRLITSENSIELLNIGVSPPHQKKLIGEGLLLQLFSAIKGRADRVFLEVRAGNERAIAFYKKYGFYPTGVRKNYYSDPLENAILMEKRLD